MLPYLNTLLKDADADFLNQVRAEQTNPETTFDEFSETVHRLLAEEAGVGTHVDAVALPAPEIGPVIEAAHLSETDQMWALLGGKGKYPGGHEPDNSDQ